MTTSTPRVRAMRQRRTEAGLTRLELLAHPEDHDILRRVAQILLDKRTQPVEPIKRSFLPKTQILCNGVPLETTVSEDGTVLAATIPELEIK